MERQWEKMESRVEKVVENHSKGYSCSQAVACAYADLVDMEESKLFQLMEGFGIGMGSMEGTCGAVVGAVAVASMYYADGTPDAMTSKAGTYQKTKQITNEFLNKNQSISCKELKGIGTGKVLRECRGCVIDAAEILEKILAQKEERQNEA